MDIDASTINKYNELGTTQSQSGDTNLNTENAKMFQDVLIRYAKVLETGGLNVSDHMFANAFHYNKSGYNYADPPQVGKSYVFITRPDFNWAKNNINAVPFFDWFIQSPLGKQCAAMLTHPHRKINHSYHVDDFPSKRKAAEKFWEEATRIQNNAGNDIDINKSDDRSMWQQMVDFMMNKTSWKYVSKWDDEVEGNPNPVQEQVNEYGNTEEYDFRMNKPPAEVEAKDKPKGDTSFWLANRVLKHYSRNGISENFRDTILYNSPFIPLLSNHCTEVPGAKDFVLGSFETEGDYYGGRLNYPTGGGDINSSGEISLTFRDNYWSQIFYLFYMWVLYIDLISRGEIMPRITNIWEKELDYTCSIYVFVLDKDQSVIKGWAKYTGCSPRSVPMGGIMHSDKSDNDNWRNISIPFVYNHVEYMNPEIFMDFNFVAETEFDRKLNNNFMGFNIWNSMKKYGELNNSKGGEGIWKNVSKEERGHSGRHPDRLLSLLTSRQDRSIGNSEDEQDAINRQMPPETLIKNEHFGYYPHIENGRFVWLSFEDTQFDSETDTKGMSLKEKLETKINKNLRDQIS